MRFPRPRTACITCLCYIGISYPACAQAKLESPELKDGSSLSLSSDSIVIPGPLRSFLRMAGISQEVNPDEVMPLLARNVALYGYSAGTEKEYLVLLDRYVHLARELQHLSDANGTIRFSGCNDSAELLSILGYKLQQGCGDRNTSLVTANPERAFLTIDSGFPLTAVEQALQQNGSFSYPFPATRVPIFFNEKDWTSVSKRNRKSDNNLLDVLLHDQNLDRLYAAMAKYDQETRLALKRSPGLGELMPLAAVIDLYGSQICIKSGRVIVPGGAEKAWEDLVGASPRSPGDFVPRLFTKDTGWLAAYFDALARLNKTQQTPLTGGARLNRFYEAYRSTAIRSDGWKGIYPRNGNLLILLASLRWQADGDFAIPGGLGLWDEILPEMAKFKENRMWLGRSHGWNTSGRLLETMVAASNLQSEIGPVQIFLILNAMSSRRPPERQLSNETDKLIAQRFPQFNRWFPIFAEFPALDDASIAEFVRAASRVEAVSNPALRANALGAFQANIGLWQILARQGQIPSDQLNSSWRNTVQPFVGFESSVQLFEGARASLESILQAATGSRILSQDQIIDLLAGPVRDDPDSQRAHHDLAERIRAVLDDQRLVSLDNLFGLFDGMTELAHGAQVGNSLLPLAGSLREFEMPRPIFTGDEKTTWAPIVYSSRHAELQVRTDLTKMLRSPSPPSQLEAARGQLTAFLRDTLVGLNYAYYEPPGAEILHNNPLFVRSHDFSSASVEGIKENWGIPRLIGIGETAGGGAYLLGSLADLPYALASAEEDFIVPKNIQALIWREVVSSLLVDATLPRWWNVSQNELHIAALTQRAGEELLKASTSDADLRAKVIGILSDRMTPLYLERTNGALQHPENFAGVISQTPPSDIFYLAFEFRRRYPDQASSWGPAGRELEDLSQRYPSEASWERLSADFGIPHPTLMFTNSCALLNMNAVSSTLADSGSLFAENWDSNNLYWARLADEMGYSPAALNVLAPKLSRDMIANIFATDMDDWPALLRAMEATGEEFRRGKITLQTSDYYRPATNEASGRIARGSDK